MLLLVIKSVFISVVSGDAQRRVKANPRTDVYHRGQGARCVYTSGFRTYMFRIGNAAVGEDFNQITPLYSRRALKNFLFVSQDSKQLRPSIIKCMSLPALG